MQRLVGPAAVRYLVENAASMLQIHLDAFCQLLRIPADHHGRYVWDPCDFGFEVTRKRNYFRNFGATAFPSAMRFGELLVACQRAWPYSQVPADPEFHVELRDGQAILNIGDYHCQQERA